MCSPGDRPSLFFPELVHVSVTWSPAPGETLDFRDYVNRLPPPSEEPPPLVGELRAAAKLVTADAGLPGRDPSHDLSLFPPSPEFYRAVVLVLLNADRRERCVGTSPFRAKKNLKKVI